MERRIELHPNFRKVREPDGKSRWERDGFAMRVLPGLRFDPERRESLRAALAERRNIIEIAKDFHIDHCTVLYWRERFFPTEQPHIASWPDSEEF